MLVYIDRPRAIGVYRAKHADQPKHTLLGNIGRAGFEFQQAPDVEVTDEERQEIQSLVTAHVQAAAAQKQWVALKYPETTRDVLQYYNTKATEAEKRLVAGAIARAARAVRVRSGPGGEQAAAKPERKSFLSFMRPTPEAIAAALYQVLADNRSSKVTGDPREGQKTQIEGLFDLDEVARKLLSLGTEKK